MGVAATLPELSEWTFEYFWPCSLIIFTLGIPKSKHTGAEIKSLTNLLVFQLLHDLL